ncbi:metalloendopeptidase [Caerostris darwini]|uniref:Metalloendopeptidase n=1 Tax=Caerostris darwini TaxID=1538125 RepID=A0AAV4UQV1_9ARAC|nr:metalloendopeptidase [Caerostris darwini]
MKAAILALCIAFLIQEVIHTLAEDLENSDQKYVEPEYLEKLYQTGQYEEFARDRSEDPMFNKGLEGGDILLRPWQKEKARQGEIFANSDSSKWNKFVPYVIDKSGYITNSATMKDVVINSATMKYVVTNSAIMKDVVINSASMKDVVTNSATMEDVVTNSATIKDAVTNSATMKAV